MWHAEGLQHAPEPMAQVKTEKDEREDIPRGNPPYLETGQHVVVNVAGNEHRIRMDSSGGELQKVEDDEGQNDGSGPVHRSRRVRRVDRLLARITHRTRSLV